ncbi:neuronal PAS domain-containing protein 4A isoform X2 [Megalops cyprinoides]|uniref:neuronal PAS domain-containing protein 4A isoform X2 n=1 Tax=Megalops cyprinoides TaxID=118141 RepID=UPI001863E0A8|nr:neuronal PAS domain-containing protein 4A isoform X2 [Megalops cyprinoides]
MYRSTKGASKARRDQINAEIRNLKDLLPISDADKARLSYLHIMSLACMYTRKSVFFSQEAAESDSHEDSARFLSFKELSELVHAMPGFLLLLTGEGKMLYLSDSVAEHLGHSMVDLVAQGDSVYDIIDPSDHFVMRSNLTPTTSPDTDRLFRCRFNTSKSARRQSAGNKLVLIRARCLTPPCPTSSPASYWTSNPVWVCFCSPLEPHLPRPVLTRETVLTLPADHAFFLANFYSQHSRDMRLQEAQDSVTVYLGFDVAVLRSRSWYSLLHPQDLSHASSQHCSLLREGGEGRVEMVVRVEAMDKSWVWLYMVLQLESGEHPISCHNYVISESEAWSLRQQISSEQPQLTLVLSASTSYQDSASLQSPDTLSSPDQVFTPSSSGLSVQSFDFSTSVCGTGSSEEQGGTALELVRPKGDPRSSLSSLEEESFFQQQSGGPPASPASSSSPTPVTVATVSDLDFLTQNIFLPPSFPLDPPLPTLPLPLPPVPTSQSQQGKEIVCTPPYTPQLGGGSFLFGEPIFSLDPMAATSPSPSASTTTTAASTENTAPTSSPPAPVSTTVSPTGPLTHSPLLPLTLLPASSSELLFPSESCSGGLYEKLPPTPDSPGDGDCTVMTLPEVRGPLYVDVPLGPLPYPPEGLLTPEASPGKQNGTSFFSLEREREKERAEISLLAQHISSLAEEFYPDPLFPKLAPSTLSSCPSSPSLSPSLPLSAPAMDSTPPLEEFYPVKLWRGLDLPLFSDDVSLFEESILESLLQDLSTSSSSSPSPCPSSPSPLCPPPSPPTPVCWDMPSPVGLSHVCSVQSAHCNRKAGGGADVGAAGEGGLPGGGGADMKPVPSPLSSACSIPPSPPLLLTASPAASSPATPATPAVPGLPCAQSLLEELAALEPVFGAGASIAPGLGQQPELYQLQCHPPPQHFHEDGSGSDPPF